MSKPILVALSFMLFVNVKADHPVTWYKDFEPVPVVEDVSRNTEQVYRLPETVVPIEYDIYIDMYFAERTERPFSYDGRENIIIQVSIKPAKEMIA